MSDTLQDNDNWVAFYDSQKGGLFHRIVRRLTRRFWRDTVRAPINRMFERGLINSYAFHEAHAYADRVIAAKRPTGEINQ